MITLRACTPGATLLVAVAAGLVSAGCDIPNFQGPQIQNPPPAFTMNREATQDRRMFPARAVVHHDAWVEASWGNFSGIYINGHLGVLGSVEVDAARRAAIEAAAGQRVQFGDVEPLQVDGRTAWGWGETWLLANGGLQYVVFRAAIPYDTITYAVDFITGDPGLKIRPDSLRTVVASFAVGKTTWSVPLILVMSGVLLLVLNTLRSRSKARADRIRTIQLATLPARGDDGPAPTPASPGAPSAATTPADTGGGDGQEDEVDDGSIARQIARQLEHKPRKP